MKPQKANLHISQHLVQLRGENVLIDADVAYLYGVETKHINQAVKNNPEKFPPGYVWTLEKYEQDMISEKNLRSKFLTTNQSMVRYAPKAFTEKGLYMLATILKSPKAIQTTIQIIETFAKLKQASRNIAQISAEMPESEKEKLLKQSGQMISEIFDETLHTNEAETSVELNLAVLKIKHTIKKKK